MEQSKLPVTIELEIGKRVLDLIPPELSFEGNYTVDLAANTRYQVEEVILQYANSLYQAQQDVAALQARCDRYEKALKEVQSKCEDVDVANNYTVELIQETINEALNGKGEVNNG